jgi:competence protein ComEA
MTIKISRKPIKYSLITTFLLLIYGSVYAQSNYENNYASWKNKQQQQDQRLKNKAEQASSNYYLAKPALQSSSNKVSLNTASVEQLMQLSGVGQKKAEAIVQYRQKNGKFNSIDELQQVKGIGPSLFNKNKDKLAL